ncbi:hypothetical protein [Ramlibacter albus]|uniref:Uncharacterized protein n=1 Tax=Ramlibacter albus TaxID=2079448 RepID=A0A923M3C5_9BURK|nr:hypothetical protein [Ramlibacter albus]MBC5763158.1 hypothetical protein [Ramlibacter albus]
MSPLLAEGLTDAVGFVAGVLVAWGISTLVGFDPLSPDWDGKALGGIVMSGIGGGAGVQVARWLRRRSKKD